MFWAVFKVDLGVKDKKYLATLTRHYFLIYSFSHIITFTSCLYFAIIIVLCIFLLNCFVYISELIRLYSYILQTERGLYSQECCRNLLPKE